MTNWHVNPDTGESGRCSAEHSCPFGGSFNGHQDTKKAAARMYEDFRGNLFEADGASYFYFLSDEDHEQFTSGDCGDLAAELHRRTGYPVVAMGSQWKNGEILWDHVAVRAPDGRILDVTGIQPESGTIAAWHYEPESFRTKEITVEEIHGALGMEDRLDAPGSDRAEIVAGRIINALKG